MFRPSTLLAASLVCVFAPLVPARADGLIKVGGGTLILGGGGFGVPGLSADLSYAGTTYSRTSSRQQVQIGAAYDFEQFRSGVLVLNGTTYPRPVTSRPSPVATFASEDVAPRTLTVTDAGAIHGVTKSGGTSDAGQILKIELGTGANGNAVVTTAANFSAPTTGSTPGDVLLADGSGLFLGVTQAGGANGKGTIYRFDPASGSITTLFSFPANLVGVANGLARGADGTIYGISSVLAETGFISVASSYHISTANDFQPLATVGATLPAHGSLFSVASDGSAWTVLKNFDASEASAVGSLSLAGTAPNFGEDTTGEAARTFFPCSMALVGGKLYLWVSGGFFQFDPGTNTSLWLMPTAKVEVPGANTESSVVVPPLGTFPPMKRERFFGKATSLTPTGSTIVFHDETPEVDGMPINAVSGTRGTIRLVPGAFESTLFVDNLVRTRSAAVSPLGSILATLSSTTALSLTTNAGHFRIDSYPSGGTALVHQGITNPRVLVDFDQVVSMTSLPQTTGPARAAVVASVHNDAETGFHLFVVDATRNDPTPAPDFDARGLIVGIGRLAYQIPIPPTISDPNGDPGALQLTSVGVHGTGSIYYDFQGVARLQYIRNSTSNGQTPIVAPVIPHDTITYTMSDDRGGTATGTIQIGNQYPTAAPDRATYVGVDELGFTIYRAELIDNDQDANGDSLSALVALRSDDPMKISKSEDGNAVIFRVPPGQSSLRTITYALTDDFSLATGQVVIGNTVPVALNPTITLSGKEPVTIDKTQIASDADADNLTYLIATPPAHGILSLSADTIIYTPVAGFAGSDSFTCEVRDPAGGTTLSTVTLRNPLRLAAGAQIALLEDPDKVGGLLRATLNAKGTATLQLKVGASTYSGVATVTATGTTTAALRSTGGPTLSVVLGFDENGALTATLNRTNSSLTGVFDRPNAELGAVIAGRYHIFLATPSGVAARGAFAIVRPKADGTVKLSGRTPDGQPWSFGGYLGETGKVSYYAPSAMVGHVFAGALVYNAGAEQAFEGFARWIRPTKTVSLTGSGSKYEPALASGANIFGEARTSFDVAFSLPGANLPAGGFEINRNNAVFPKAGTEVLRDLVLLPRSGLLSGKLLWRGDLGEVPFIALLGTEPRRGVGLLANGVVVGGFVVSPSAP